MILHFSQIFFTEGLTFTVYFHLSSCLSRICREARDRGAAESGNRTYGQAGQTRSCPPESLSGCTGNRTRREMRNRLRRQRHPGLLRQATLCRSQHTLRIHSGKGRSGQRNAAGGLGHGHTTRAAEFTQVSAGVRPDLPQSAFRSPGDSALGRVVDGNFHRDLIARENADIVHSELTGNMSRDNHVIRKLNLERSVRQRFHDCTFELNYIILRQMRFLLA